MIDGIVREPHGGAHRDPDAVVASTGDAVAAALSEFAGMDRDAIRQARADKFLAIGRGL